nr:putative reverse transcriptase domain-containing protein [Tanacetum cinerariifolium]
MHLKGLVAFAFNCNRPGHLEKVCRGVPRNVNPINVRNPPVRACYECGLPPLSEIEFWIELIHRAVPVVNSPYRLRPSELEELSGQLKELKDKGFL